MSDAKSLESMSREELMSALRVAIDSGADVGPIMQAIDDLKYANVEPVPYAPWMSTPRFTSKWHRNPRGTFKKGH
jgi:hypothetical protein